MKSYDICILAADDGKMEAHHPDCIHVDKARKADKPILTMMGCTEPPPADVLRHLCLMDDKGELPWNKSTSNH